MPPIRLTRLVLWLAIMAAASGNRIQAAETGPDCPSSPPGPALPPLIPLDDDRVHVEADEARLLDDTAEFSGNVILQRRDMRVRADRLRYEKSTDRARAEGGVILDNVRGDRFETGTAEVFLQDKTGFTGPGRYSLAGHGRGDAERILLEGEYKASLTGVRFTTCPPDKESWYLKIGKLKLDRKRDIAVARNGTAWFYHVPVFYWPYLDFPLSGRRKSGFLAPEVGSSNTLGTTLATPYYFNIAPQLDDTLTPRYLSKRGLQLQNEFRYLGRSYSGRLDAEYLPFDQQFNDARGAAAYRHQQRFGRRWNARADLSWVSDDQYLDDFGNSLSISSQTQLRQELSLRYEGDWLRFGGRAFRYQTIDPDIADDELPYMMLPQLYLVAASPPRPNRLNARLDSEWVDFERKDSVVGERWYLRPELRFPLRNRYAFLVPAAGAYYWGYNLDRTPESQRTPGFDTRPANGLGYGSLDAGLVFDRFFRFRQRSYIQTLEPRVFYVYVPAREQDSLPVFDTTLPDFSFDNLFRENRFVGRDRVGDANQVTVALTSRILDGERGIERLRLSVGEIYYFADRQVNLPAGTETARTSDIIGEIQGRLRGNWFLRGILQWDREQKETERWNAFVQYHPKPDRILNLGYRFQHGTERQSELSFEWPLWRRWTVTGRWNYSWRDRENLESLLGLGYRSCCWGLRVYADRRLSASGNQRTAIRVQLELRGLAQVGSLPFSPLRRGLFSEF